MINKNHLKLVVAFLTITVFLTGCLFKNKTSDKLNNNGIEENQKTTEEDLEQENADLKKLLNEIEDENDDEGDEDDNEQDDDSNIDKDKDLTVKDSQKEDNEVDIIVDKKALQDKNLVIDPKAVVIESGSGIKVETQPIIKPKIQEVVFAKYEIQDGTKASYTVQKKWFSKPSESVTGTTQNVEGSFMYLSSTGELKDLTVNIDSQTFDTGSGGRDRVVKGLFDGPIRVVLKNLKIKTESTIIPMDLTINSKTQKTNFTVTTNLKDKLLSATGSANIKLSQFGIEPPSLLDVYTVDDALAVSFEMSAMVK